MKIFTLFATCKKPAIAGLAVLLSCFGFIAHAQNKVLGITVSPTQTGTLTYGTPSDAIYTVTLTKRTD
jgi:hypothetical protein